MKKILLISIISLISILNYAQTTFERTYGGSGNDSAACVQQTSDGGYIICGSTNSFGVGDFDVYVIKMSASGVKSWAKTFGGAAADYGNDIKSTSDGGYIITGSSKNFNSGVERVYLLKLDVNGDLIWSETLGESISGKGNSVIETSDGGYAVTGSSINSDGMKVIYLLKTTNDGTGVFEMHFPFEGAGHSILESFEGGFVLNGIVSGSANSVSKNILIKTDEFGNNLWSRTYGNDNYFFNATNVIQSRDGGYSIGGGAKSITGNSAAFLIKVDPWGGQLWAKSYSSGEGVSVQPTHDNGYIISGAFNAANSTSDVFLTKTDSLGTVLWSNVFGGINNEIPISAFQTNDEGYVIAGKTTSFGEGGSDAYIVKMNEYGHTSCSSNAVSIIEQTLTLVENVYTFQPAFNYYIPSVTVALTVAANASILGTALCYIPTPTANISSGIIYEDLVQGDTVDVEKDFSQKSFSEVSRGMTFSVFPNPNDGENINITLESSVAEEILVVVYDQLGREHYSKIIITEENSANVFAIDPKGNLLPGIYMVTATSGKETFTKRLIVK